MEEAIEKLKEWVKKNYNSSTCGYTAMRSYGNYDDCFDDGRESGISCAAYDVGSILGMDLEEPEQPSYD